MQIKNNTQIPFHQSQNGKHQENKDKHWWLMSGILPVWEAETSRITVSPGKQGTLIHWWWEYKLVQQLWNSSKKKKNPRKQK
jgi:hypothetical protein